VACAVLASMSHAAMLPDRSVAPARAARAAMEILQTSDPEPAAVLGGLAKLRP
jgi:hypothetical protein